MYGRGLDGSGRTIVIVNPYGSPTIEHDLHVFDQTFALGDLVSGLGTVDGPALVRALAAN